MSVELFGEEGTLKGLILALEDRSEWIVGRDPDLCHLLLEDPLVSRVHARIEKKEEEFVLENLSKSNPLMLNDKSVIDILPLQEGDKIKIGGTIFRFYPTGTPAPVEHLSISEEREEPYETIFREEEKVSGEDVHIDLSTPARFVLKVIAGPNSGAEFALEEGRSYLLGTDTAACDIVFYDLSVSRQHARIELTLDGRMFIQDLNSRNGVVVDRSRIEIKTELYPNQVVVLGTTAFLVVDREAPVKTIISSPYEVVEEKIEKEGDKKEEIKEEEKILEEKPEEPSILPPSAPSPTPLSPGALILAVILGCIAVLIGIGMVSLFHGGKEVVPVKRDYAQEVQTALKPFPGVRFTYNPLLGRLFLVGHVSTGIEKNELLYNLRGLRFLKGVEDNVVIDESIWQEMNILLPKENPNWKAVAMHSPFPGEFVLSGYLKSADDASQLNDYMNRNFPYLSGLRNQVIVEQDVMDQIQCELNQENFGGVIFTFNNGELFFGGYISSTSTERFGDLLKKFSKILGVRDIRNCVVLVSPEKSVVDLKEKSPGRYQVTGYATHCDVNINVVINGKIFTRGDLMDGMTITSIQPNTIYLEKDGLKYKLEYNK